MMTIPNPCRGLWILLVAVSLAGCAHRPPSGLSAVTPFAGERYLGRWYEIARLDHWYERGLTDVRAVYRRQADGTLEVINRGYDPTLGEWRQAVGRALCVGDPQRASLKVSFFGPFYGGYHVVALDSEYRWALVVGDSRDAFWILARERSIPPELRETLLARARALGIDTAALIWTPQTRGDG